MPRRSALARPASMAALAAILLTGCGTTTEPGSNGFYREHAGEARRAAASMAALQSAQGALGADPSAARREALASLAHRAHRALLAAVNWTPAENGEEEGVSQAEKEIHEGAQALLGATYELGVYAQKGDPAALASYRRQLAAGREYWNQGMRELWYVSKRSNPPDV